MNKEHLIHQIAKRQADLGVGKSELARRSGVSRKMLYLFEKQQSDLSLEKFMAVVQSLGLRLDLVEDFERLPADHRQRKTEKQLAYLSSGKNQKAEGFFDKVQIKDVFIPDIGDFR